MFYLIFLFLSSDKLYNSPYTKISKINCNLQFICKRIYAKLKDVLKDPLILYYITVPSVKLSCSIPISGLVLITLVK